MELKHYQERVIRETHAFFKAVATQRDAGQLRYASVEAFRELGLGRYEPRENGLGKDLPSICLKVPTGGGKTLLATQALGSIHQTILRDRNGTGLALWVVPSSQIYTDTLRRLKDERDDYHIMLRHAVHGAVSIWTKEEIARMTPAQLGAALNILVVQLASTNRQSKETLKFFADSEGNIVRHFPDEDDSEGHRKLKERFPNLEMIDQSEGRWLCRTSVGNLVRMCEPSVIIDEAHKFRSHLAWDTVADFNAAAIVELSATPKPFKSPTGAVQHPNIVSRVGGQELLDEEMIKLPLNIASSGKKDWKDLLTQARDKRIALAKAALQSQSVTGRHIRPIVLIQVERTGSDQRGATIGGRLAIHSEDVREYLVDRLGVSSKAIAVKASEKDELIEHTDLLAEGCPIEWIITKSALQEGWDCPFAYILASLNNTGGELAMTQLVGRILRQPFQRRLPDESLNESYVYCLHATAASISAQVKQALEKEGYEDVGRAGLIVDASGQHPAKNGRDTSVRERFLDDYRPHFDGKIYLPKFCVKENGSYHALDYFSHLIAKVDVDAFKYETIDWPLASRMTEARDRFYSLTLNSELRRQAETDVDLVESDSQVRSWLTTNMGFEFLSFKKMRRVVQSVCDRLIAAELQLVGKLGLVKFVIRDHLTRFIQEQVDLQTKAAFDDLFDRNRILFYLECKQCRFDIPPSIRIERTGPITPLRHDNGDELGKSLFDFVELESQNQYERQIALVLDRQADVLWWYRNKVGPGNFMIQGYKKDKIYPDFVVRQKDTGHHHVLVLESKGKHLEGNPDTLYKRAVAAYFERAGSRVSWQQLGEAFKDHVFRFQILDEAQAHGRDWRDELDSIVSDSPVDPPVSHPPMSPR